MLKIRDYNGKSVVPVYPNPTYSSMLTIPGRLAHKYNLFRSDITIEEKMNGDLLIKKAYTKTRHKTFQTGRSSCGLIIPSYLAHKHGYAGNGCYAILTEEDNGILIKKLLI